MIAFTSISGPTDLLRRLRCVLPSRACALLAVAAGLFASVCAHAQSPTSETPAALAAEVSPAPSPTAPARLLYPGIGSLGPSAPGARRDEPGVSGLAMTMLTLLGVCAAGWFLLRRGSSLASGAKAPRKLVVSETRSLGNRQFLVVVEYEHERVLLGVTPGKIDYLCPLPMAGAPAMAVYEEKPS